MRIQEKIGYTFNDVLLVPQYSEITSRSTIDISTKVGEHLKLKLPIISANMDTVTEGKMAIAMANAGGAGILHRFAPVELQANWLAGMRSLGVKPRIISVGLDVDMDGLIILAAEYDLDAICIDVAHGDHKRVLDLLKSLRQHFPGLDIIAGNVVSPHSIMRLVDSGANIIKVGVGPGSVCTTRLVTGHGYPQLSAIANIYTTLMSHSCTDIGIIADGGIKNSGDIVKALAAGAHAVMLGSLLAGTDETPGESFYADGVLCKRYRGMASLEVQREKRPDREPRVEGVSVSTAYRGPLNHILKDLEDGIKSGLSYSGAKNLFELRKYAEFVVVTQNGVAESSPHHRGNA